MRFMSGWTVTNLMDCPKSYVLAIMEVMAESAREIADGDRG